MIQLPSKNRKRGLLYVKPTYQDYHQKGPLRLGGLPIMPNGHGWGAFLPTPEFQDQYTETMACASFNTLKAVQTLQKQEFTDTQGWSDRFLANISGTTTQGNDPNRTAETLRKQGCVWDTDWPYTPDINTWAKFYSTIPYDLNVQAQVKFRGKYDFGHQWVGTDPQSMKNALAFSPLCADVFAWNEPDAQGIYHRNGQVSEHWTMIYDYVEGQYWMVLDSYPPFQKKLAWDFGFGMVKEYTLHKQVVGQTQWWQAILYFFGLHPNWV